MMMSFHASTAVVFATAVAFADASDSDTRMVSWWFDVAESAETDANNLAAIKEHQSVFSRVMVRTRTYVARRSVRLIANPELP
jgi:hypothetical protein